MISKLRRNQKVVAVLGIRSILRVDSMIAICNQSAIYTPGIVAQCAQRLIARPCCATKSIYQSGVAMLCHKSRSSSKTVLVEFGVPDSNASGAHAQPRAFSLSLPFACVRVLVFTGTRDITCKSLLVSALGRYGPFAAIRSVTGM